MFGHNISFQVTKQLLLEKLSVFEYNITTDSKTCFVAGILIKQRRIEFKIIEYKRGQITVDVIDPFAFVRIPRKTFRKQEEAKIWIMECFVKLTDERNR
ncbi:MAG: hypothetical protein J6V44_15105 [Methanobrevibacter sp.]|nr:hypothetical protein [Methanobrevibacter sp.]MBO7696558.1 hypothetical protein [Methanobrevibacter sp.]